MLLTSTGHWMELVAQGWLVVQLTDSPLIVGLVAGGQGVAQLLFGAVGGVVADLVDRRRLLIFSLVGRALVNLGLALLVAFGVAEIWHVAAFAVIQGLLGSIMAPARHTFLYDLIGREHLVQAVAMNQTANNLTRVMGPATGGFIVAFAGIHGCYYAITVCWLLGAAAMSLIRVRSIPAERTDRSVWGTLIEGLRYVGGRKALMVLLGAGVLADFFAFSHRFLLPLFARDILMTDAVGLGVLFSASGVGSLIGAAAMGALAREDNRGWLLVSSLFLFGVALVLFAYSAWFPMACLFLLIAGGMGNAFDALVATSLQMLADDAYRGRIMGLYVLTWGMSPIGGFQAGAVASVLGVPFAIALGGVLCAVTAVAVLKIAPEMVFSVPRREAVGTGLAAGD